MVWFGLFAPAGTPKPVVAHLNGKVNACLTLRSEAAPAGGLSANSAVEEQNTAAQASKRQTTRFMGFPLGMGNTKLSVYHTGTASLALMLLRSRLIPETSTIKAKNVMGRVL